jgi:hypothetical protein
MAAVNGKPLRVDVMPTRLVTAPPLHQVRCPALRRRHSGAPAEPCQHLLFEGRFVGRIITRCARCHADVEVTSS